MFHAVRGHRRRALGIVPRQVQVPMEAQPLVVTPVQHYETMAPMAPSSSSTSSSSSGTTSSSPAPAPQPDIAWNDWANQTQSWALMKLARSFQPTLRAVSQQTTNLYSQYKARVLGAGIESGGDYTTFRMPNVGMQADGTSGGIGCPELGPASYIYADLFVGAQDNLKTLAANPPPRYTGANLVLQWLRLVRGNIALLRAATNIRSVFQFPNSVPDIRWVRAHEYSGQHVPPVSELVRASEHTSRTCIGDCDSPTGWVDGMPYPLYKGAGYEVNPGVPDALEPQEWFDWLETFLDNNLGSAQAHDAGIRNTFSHAVLAPGPWLYPKLTTYSTMNEQSGAQVGDIIDDPGYVEVVYPAPRPNYNTQALQGAIPVQWTNENIGQRLFYRRTADGVDHPSAPIFTIEAYVKRAEIYSRLVLGTIVAEAFGFFAFNHLPFFAATGKLNMTPAQVAAFQQAAMAANLRSNQVASSVTAIAGSVIAAINPVLGIVFQILNTLGQIATVGLISGSIDVVAPRFMWTRMPALNCPQPDTTALEAAIRARQGQANEDAAAEQRARQHGIVPQSPAVTLPYIPPPTVSNLPWVFGLFGLGGLVALIFFLRSRKSR